MTAIKTKTVPKGDIFEVSRTAGLFAIKRTADIIPDCHPLPIEYAHIHFELLEMEIHVFCEVKTIYKTGVEVEAMLGASVVALTLYDMLKPIDKKIEISHIQLIEKSGGKSDFQSLKQNLKVAVIVCSDRVHSGKREDSAGKLLMERFREFDVHYDVVPDEEELIRECVKHCIQNQFDLVVTTGGTGLSKRDRTPEAVFPLIDRNIPGVMEIARSYGQQRTPYAMLSRGVAGFASDTLIITLPGSIQAVIEIMDALFPYILHLFSIRDGEDHQTLQKTISSASIAASRPS